MKQINIGSSGFFGSSIVLGCMRINSRTVDEAEKLIALALDSGIDYFDHADIYGDGASEELFGQVISRNPGMRDKMKIQSKCGIARVAGTGTNCGFDFSEKHIIEAVEGSLSRLRCDHLDALLLHRPDTLMEPEEVASAFDKLEASGKVLRFGVSNQTPMQIELLKTCVRQPLLINQLQLSLLECGMITQGMNTNMTNTPSYMHDGSILEYSRINKMTIQAWSPFQAGFFEGVFIDNDKYPELNAVLAKYAAKYGVSKTAIAAAWILRHPAEIQVIAGTTSCEHLREITDADRITLSRAEWYDLYTGAGHILP